MGGCKGVLARWDCARCVAAPSRYGDSCIFLPGLRLPAASRAPQAPVSTQCALAAAWRQAQWSACGQACASLRATSWRWRCAASRAPLRSTSTARSSSRCSLSASPPRPSARSITAMSPLSTFSSMGVRPRCGCDPPLTHAPHAPVRARTTATASATGPLDDGLRGPCAHERHACGERVHRRMHDQRGLLTAAGPAAYGAGAGVPCFCAQGPCGACFPARPTPACSLVPSPSHVPSLPTSLWLPLLRCHLSAPVEAHRCEPVSVQRGRMHA
jgi:hypothetical protein